MLRFLWDTQLEYLTLIIGQQKTSYWKIISKQQIFVTLDDKHTATKQLSDLQEEKNMEIKQLNQDLHAKSREIEVLHKTDNTKDDAIAALSDKLQNLIEEVENLKKRK